MTGNWVLITGSSRGLGLEIAIKFAQAGFRTVITGRTEETLAQALAKIKSLSHPVHLSVRMDMTAEESPQLLFNRLKQQGITISVIVNNLGGSVPGDRRNIPPDILRKSMRLNLETGVEINNLFYDDLKEQIGMIVHIGSTASLHFDAPPGYVISKTAVNAYVKNAARAFAKDNVCICAILPGILEHEGSYIDRMRVADQGRYEMALAKTAFGRFATSEEVARFVITIVNAKSSMLNGALIQLDGGGA